MKNDKPFSATSTCPVCTSDDISTVMEILQVPVHCNLLWSTREQAIQAPKGDIRLEFCRACGHMYNCAFDPSRLNYDQDYENPLHFSPRFQEYARSLALGLRDRYDLHDKDIIEIGCGNGSFLHLLCELGNSRGIGFDPSYAPRRSESGDDERIRIIKDFYSESYADYQADLICCRHVLEHIHWPRSFLANLRKTIGKKTGTMLFFEVPNVMFTLRDLGIWDIIYEHCGYFSSSSLAVLFRSCGFDVKEVSEMFGGQFLAIEAMPTQEVENSRSDKWCNPAELAPHVAAFSENYRKTLGQWRSEIKAREHLGQRVVVWGGGSKGVTFLNMFEESQIEYLVDINPHKHGKYVAGTGQEIVSPRFLQQYRPDTIIVMNPIYFDEIRKTVREMDLPSELTSV